MVRFIYAHIVIDLWELKDQSAAMSPGVESDLDLNKYHENRASEYNKYQDPFNESHIEISSNL